MIPLRRTPVRRRVARLAAIPFLLGAMACGGGDGERPPSADTAGPAPGRRPTGDTTVPAMPDSAGPDRDAAPVADTTAVEGERAPGPGEDTTTVGDEAADLPPWTSAASREPGRDPVRLLQAVRTGRHEGFDRLVLQFAGGVPGYEIGFPGEPLAQCGSGRPVDPGAPVALRIQLRPAAAHEDGAATIEDRDRAPGLPILRTARLTCDFEASVEWVLGLAARTSIRVFTLGSPDRLVVDVRHR